MKRFAIVILALTLLCACAPQKATLIDMPEQTPVETADATPTPTPEPEPLEIAPIDGEGFVTDINGLPILNERTHYFDYYLTLSNLRLYEHNEETLIDAVILNSFSKTLSGALRISFVGEDGIRYGYGDFYTANGDLVLIPGENRVYCDVHTEVDVQDMAFNLEVVTPFKPGP